MIKTSNMNMLQDPQVHVNPPKQVIGMVNKDNMEELMQLNDRTVDGPREGFGSLMPNHNRQHEKRYF